MPGPISNASFETEVQSKSRNKCPVKSGVSGGWSGRFNRTCGDDGSGLGKGGDIAGCNVKLACQISIVPGGQVAGLPVCRGVMRGFGNFRCHCKQAPQKFAIIVIHTATLRIGGSNASFAAEVHSKSTTTGKNPSQ